MHPHIYLLGRMLFTHILPQLFSSFSFPMPFIFYITKVHLDIETLEETKALQPLPSSDDPIVCRMLYRKKLVRKKWQ